jgi:hypothetical protein
MSNNPITWVRYGFEAARALLDLYKAGRDIKSDSEAHEQPNPVKVREQAAGSSAGSESRNAGKPRLRVIPRS